MVDLPQPGQQSRELVIDQPANAQGEMDMRDESVEPMSVENVEEFDVWIFDSRNLVVSVVPHHAPSSATTEEYEISER